MSEQFLELELRLLILRHGRRRVLEALAQLSEQSPVEMEEQLRAAEARPKKKRAKPSVIDLADAQCRDNPDIAEPLRSLAVRFQNRTFLPRLRDVQRFLDRVAPIQRKLKSRETAAPLLMGTLASLTREDLIRLASENSTPSESDYSLLARAIMRTQPSEPRGQTGRTDDQKEG